MLCWRCKENPKSSAATHENGETHGKIDKRNPKCYTSLGIFFTQK